MGCAADDQSAADADGTLQGHVRGRATLWAGLAVLIGIIALLIILSA